MNEHLPALIPFHFEEPPLQFSCGAWVPPKSAFAVPVIEFAISRDVEPVAEVERVAKAERVAGVPPESAQQFIRFRCREVVDAVEPAHGLLIDLHRLPRPLLGGLDPVPERTRWMKEPVRIVVPEGEMPPLAESVSSHEIVTSRERAMSELAFELKRHRSDGGTTMPEPRPVPSPRIEPVTLHVSPIGFRYHTWPLPSGEGIGGWIVIAGDYRHGSAGSDDAMMIRWRSSQFCDIVKPDALVIDLRELRYEWGDDLSLYPPDFSGPDSPIRFIIGPEQQESLKGELYPQNVVHDERSAFEAFS